MPLRTCSYNHPGLVSNLNTNQIIFGDREAGTQHFNQLTSPAVQDQSPGSVLIKLHGGLICNSSPSLNPFRDRNPAVTSKFPGLQASASRTWWKGIVWRLPAAERVSSLPNALQIAPGRCGLHVFRTLEGNGPAGVGSWKPPEYDVHVLRNLKFALAGAF